MPGQVYTSSKQLDKFRKQQLLDIARAWEIPVDSLLPKAKILRILEAKEDEGVFMRPPKNLYYFRKAAFTSDDVKNARANGGYTDDGRLVEFLHPWTGPNPDPEPAKPTYDEMRAKKREVQKQNASKSVIAQLRVEAKKRGINSFAKGRDELARLIAEHDGTVAKKDASVAS